MFGFKFLHASKFSLLPLSSPLLHDKETVLSEMLVKVLTVPVPFTESELLGIL